MNAGERQPLRIDVLTIFPGVFDPVLGESITRRARDAGLVDWRITDIRRHAQNKHDKVDDRPFGGGPGMVMMCQPIYDAVVEVEKEDPRAVVRLLMSPQGEPLTQGLVEELATQERLLIVCGHYEGVDERVVEKLGFREVSVADFVVSGGELPAMMLIDAIVRLLPGALGHEASAAEDSFSRTGDEGLRLLDCPHYTRPREWMGMGVPETLISGDHAKVDEWRMNQRITRTQERRPDLLKESDEA